LKKRTPAPTEITKLPRRERSFFWRIVVSAGHSLEVKEFGNWCPDDTISSVAKTHAEVDIIEGDRQLLI
jgi:hypothetical protein